MPKEVERRGPGAPAVFDQPGKWETLIELVRSGMGGYEAAEAMGHSWRTLNRFMKANPEAREEFAIAKREAREEPAMRFLKKQMEDDELEPMVRQGAADKLIRHSQKDMEAVVRHEHVVTADPEALDDIKSFRDMIASRRAAEPVIDVESTEVTQPKEQDD